MKKINDVEQKKLLIDMMKYIDDICEENNINYTLIGGSLIGAVREQGIIPWDDDIDISLMPTEYNKLIKILHNKESKYKIMTNEYNNDYYYPFAKLVDTTTILSEKNVKPIKDYGLFIDIFCYNNIPNNQIKRVIYSKKLKFMKQLITGYASSSTNIKNFLNPKMIRNNIANFIGIKKIMKRYLKYAQKYNSQNCKEIISCWPVYELDKEIQLKSNFENYIEVPFENIKVKIIKNYDGLLKVTFGDYMKRPDKAQQIKKHDLDVYWKD